MSHSGNIEEMLLILTLLSNYRCSGQDSIGYYVTH